MAVRPNVTEVTRDTRIDPGYRASQGWKEDDNTELVTDHTKRVYTIFLSLEYPKIPWPLLGVMAS